MTKLIKFTVCFCYDVLLSAVINVLAKAFFCPVTLHHPSNVWSRFVIDLRIDLQKKEICFMTKIE